MMDVEQIARRMFDRIAATYDADPALAELAWADPDIRAHHIAEAEAVIADVQRMCLARHPAVDQVSDLPGQLTIDDVEETA